jgi:hypothetical protein
VADRDGGEDGVPRAAASGTASSGIFTVRRERRLPTESGASLGEPEAPGGTDPPPDVEPPVGMGVAVARVAGVWGVPTGTGACGVEGRYGSGAGPGMMAPSAPVGAGATIGGALCRCGSTSSGGAAACGGGTEAAPGKVEVRFGIGV